MEKSIHFHPILGHFVVAFFFKFANKVGNDDDATKTSHGHGL